MRKLILLALVCLFCPGVFAGSMGPGVLVVSSEVLKLDETEIANSDVVLLCARGLSFSRFGYGIELRHIKGVIKHLSGKDTYVSNKKGLEQYLQVLRQADPYAYDQPLYIPDSYLGDFLKARIAETGKKYAVVPLDWSRDADDSVRQSQLIDDWIEQAYAMAAKYNKPVYIVAHSWGSVLTYSVLNRMVARKSPVQIQKFVTMGSPLRPSAFWMKAAVDVGLASMGLDLKVRKPENVKSWVNLWALRDRISNAIPAADLNIRVDEDADAYRSKLRKIIDAHFYAKHGRKSKELLNGYDGEKMLGISNDEFKVLMDGNADLDENMPPEYANIRHDLKLLNSTTVWHGSYFAGVVVNLKSTGGTYRNDVVRKYFLPLFE